MLELQSDVDPEVDDLFNAWCDHHHAELLSLPGVLRARRYVRTDGRRGTGRYLTVYDLDSAAVLDTPTFLRHSTTGTPIPEALGPSLVYERTVATLVGSAGDISGADGLIRALVPTGSGELAPIADRLLKTGPRTVVGVRLFHAGNGPEIPVVAFLDRLSPGSFESPRRFEADSTLTEAVAYRLVFDDSSPRPPTDPGRPG
jgi:hypothetical protein